MTTRTETQPVAGQHQPAARRPLLDDWFPARYWRWIGTAIRIVVVVVLLVSVARQGTGTLHYGWTR